MKLFMKLLPALLLLGCHAGDEVPVDPPRPTALDFSRPTIYLMANVLSATITSGLGSGSYINSVDPIVELGHCWSATNRQPTLQDRHKGYGRTYTLTTELTNLSSDSTYSVDSYALSNSGKVYYGRDVKAPVTSFTPFICDEKQPGISVAQTKIKVPEAVRLRNSGSFMLDGQAYFLQYDGIFWGYDIAANTWQAKASLPDTVKAPVESPYYTSERSQQAVFTDGQYGYSAFGYRRINYETRPTGEMYQYDPRQDKWTQLPSFTALGDHAFTYIGRDADELLFVNRYYQDAGFWSFSLTTGVWQPVTLAVREYNITGAIQLGRMLYWQVAYQSGGYILAYNLDTKTMQPLPDHLECGYRRSTDYSMNLFFALNGQIFVGADQLDSSTLQARGVVIRTSSLAQFDLTQQRWTKTINLANSGLPLPGFRRYTLLSDQKQALLLDLYYEKRWVLGL